MKPVSAYFDPVEKRKRKFSWFPKQSTQSGKWIWLRWYWEVRVFIDPTGKMPINSTYWLRILTDSEALVEEIKKPR